MTGLKQHRISIADLNIELKEPQKTEFLMEEMGAAKYLDAFRLPLTTGEAWLFTYGILVCWDVKASDQQLLSQRLVRDFPNVKKPQTSEQYSYAINNDQNLSIRGDHLTLPADDKMIRLSLSHAFAQSTKLMFFENKTQKLISDNRHLSQHLAKTGKIPLTRSLLAKLRGKLFEAASDITVHHGLLGTPDFFWDYPHLEYYYSRLAGYLDLKPRIEVLDKKLSTIHELLDMLAAEQHHKHSSFLEWIIILLIAFDIGLYLF